MGGGADAPAEPIAPYAPLMQQLNMAPPAVDDAQLGRFREFLFSKTKLFDMGRVQPADFQELQELGRGNGGSVWKVRHRPTGIVLARKMIHLDLKPKVREQILRELTVLNTCNSPESAVLLTLLTAWSDTPLFSPPSVVNFYGSFYADSEINLLMEYMDGGSLDRVLLRVGRLPEPVVATTAAHVLSGLLYLQNSIRVLHRDIKPSNILVNSLGEIKLCDFGVSGALRLFWW